MVSRLSCCAKGYCCVKVGLESLSSISLHQYLSFPTHRKTAQYISTSLVLSEHNSLPLRESECGSFDDSIVEQDENYVKEFRTGRNRYVKIRCCRIFTSNTKRQLNILGSFSSTGAYYVASLGRLSLILLISEPHCFKKLPLCQYPV